MNIIFIPGLLSTSLIWGETNAIRHNWDCYDAAITGFDRIEKLSESIIQNFPTGDIALIGISMGGYIAMDVALNTADRIKKLVLINTTPNSVNKITIPDREKAIKFAEIGDMASILKMSQGACYYQPKQEWILLEKKMADETGCSAYIKQQQAIIHRKNYSPLLKNILCETLIISGKEDKIAPYQDSIFMFEDIKKSNLILLSECGHLSTLEKGDIVAKEIINFLSM